MRNQKLGIHESTADTVLYHRIPIELYEKIVAFINEREYRTRTAAINDLLHTGLTVANNMNKIQDPELVSEIRAQLHEGGLVHYVETLNPHQLEVIWSIVDNEVRDRASKFKKEYKIKE